MKNLKFILLAFVHWVFLAATAQAHYDPTIGQFISRDPTGEVEDINLYRITGNDPINYVDAGGLAKVALDGTGNITPLGQTILDVAKGDPNAARSMLMAAQVDAETTGIKVPGDGGQDSMRNVMEAIETAVGQAQSDGSREWKMIAAGAGLSGERSFGGYKDAWMTAKLAEYAPLIAANAQTAIKLRAFERAANEKSTIEQNSPGYKLREIGLATADIPMHLGAAVLSGAMATDVTTGNAITWNGWGNGGFGFQEISPGERTFAAAMVFLPMGRVEGVADDFVRVATSGRSFAGTALKPWGAVEARFWSKAEFQGTRIYQRNDLIDAAFFDARGRTNLQRMQSGLAPVGPDGKSLNLHHTIQRDNGPLAEMMATFHQQNSSVIHINPSTIPSGIDRRGFDVFRSNYWMNRANDFLPSP